MANGDNLRTSIGKKLIYMVDDEPMLLELTKAILSGYQVEVFRSGEAALKAYHSAQQMPDLLITDFAMNGMNGLQLLEQCRKLHPQQKALLLSGSVEEDVNSRSPSPADAFLAKPYQPRDLIDVVQRVLT